MGLFTIIAAVLSVVSFAASYQQAKKAQKAAKRARAGMAGVLVNKESSNEHIPVVYGERRVGGTRVFMSTSGVERHKYLYVALVLSEGEVTSIEDIEIDEVPLSDSRFNGLVYVNKKYGTDDQERSDLLAEAFIDESDIIDEWEGISVPDLDQYAPNFKLSGVAYLALRMEYDREVFNGIPDITAKVKGRKVYDPRQDSTSTYYDSSVGVATQRANDTSTWEWSDNPSICLRDYLTNDRFGKDLPGSALNEAEFMQSADDLDGFTVTPYSGGPSTHKLFRLNAVVDTGEELFKNVEQMLLACRGFLPYNFGKYALKIDQATTSQMTLGTDKIVGDIAIAGSKKEDRFNQVIVTFPNAGTNFRPDNAVWPNPSSSRETSISDGQGGYLTEAQLHDQFLLEDGEDLIDEIDLEYCTDRYAARDLARIFCWRSRYAINVAFTATSEAMELEVGDVIGITHPTPDWTAKKFQIDEMNLNFDGTVTIKAIEHVQSIYAYDPDAEEVFGPDRVRPQPDVLAPTNFSGNNNGSAVLADGTFHAVLNMSWTASNDVFVIEYEVAWRLPGDSYSYLKTPDTSVRIEGLEPGTYQIRVRAINYRGATSDWVIGANVNLTNDDTAPGLPTDIEALGDLESILVKWTNPTDADFKGVEIFASDVATAPSTNDTPTAFRTGTGFFEAGLYPGQFRHYYLRSVDFTGNKSAFSSRVFAEATGVRVRNLALLVNQNAYPTNLPANEIRFNEEYEILTHGTTDFTDLGAADNNVGTIFTATRNGDPEEGSGTVEHTSHETNNGELALVASTLRGAPIYGESGSIVWNGETIAVEHNNSNSFTVLTNLADKQGWIAFDRNGTAPFDMSGTLGNFDTGFVYYEDGQWYYDDDSANPVSFNPDSFTGTTTGTDGTSTAKLVALGALKTGSSADSISEAGLFSDPRDLKTVELPQNFIEVTNFATQLESDTYVQDTSGWKIERSGDVEFNNITARGEIHATSGSISESVQIGGTDLNDYVSQATGSLALMINKQSGGTLTGNGEAVLVGVEQGAAVTQQNGFITWDGAQVEIDYDQTAQSATFATQVQEQRGFICVDVNKETPFTINSGGGTVNVDVAFVYKIDDQWYYDNNSSSTTGVSFTPSTLVGSDGSSATELVAIGFIETESSDVIKYGGLFGQPVPLELAAMPADALESGSIGGIKISNNKLYEGVGSFKDANTGFYLDSGGDFSLKDKLSFDNSAGELIVDGTVRADVIDIVDGALYGDIEASSVAAGQVGIDEVSETVYNEIKRRFINSKDGFYFTDTDSIDGTSAYNYITTGDLGNSALTTEPIELEAVFTYRFTSTTNYTATNRDFFARFEWSNNGTSWSTVSSETEVRHEVTQTQTEFGYVYELNEVQRETVTLPSNYGYLRLVVQLSSTSGSSWTEHPLAVSFIADQAGLIIGSAATTGEAQFPDGIVVSGITYPDADGTSGQVITTDGSGNLSFSTVSGGGSGDITSVIAGTNLTGGATSGAATLNVAQKLTGNVVELTGGIAFDPEGGGTGTDTASDVGIALSSGTRIVGTNDGYIRNLLDWNSSSSIDIGQTATSLINGVNLYGGNGSTPLKYQNGNGYITIGPNNSGYSHFYTDRPAYYFNKKIVVDEGIINSYNEDLQLAAGVGQAASIVIDYPSNEVTFNEHLNIASGARINHNTDSSRDKIRVWESSAYAIGMDNAMSYGHLNDYAMTFQFSNTDARGWVFLDTGHSDAQGAMSLSTNGKMTVATSLSVGEGESITSPSTKTLYVGGEAQIAGNVAVTGAGSRRIDISNTSLADTGEMVSLQWDSNADLTFQGRSSTGAFKANWYRIEAFATDGFADAHRFYTDSSVERMSITSTGIDVTGEITATSEITGARLTSTIHGNSVNAFGYLAGGDTDEDNKSNYITHGDTGVTVVRSWDGTSVGNIATFDSTGIDVTGDLIVSAGDVGIGEANPAYKLDLIGTIRIQEDAQTGYTHSRLITESNSTSRGSGHFMWTSPGATEWYMGRPYSVGDEWMVARRQGGTIHSDATADRQYALLTVKNSGRVGIGEKDPDSMLEVNAGSLGTTGGNELPVLNLQFASSNSDRLTVTARRKSTGTDWQTAAHKIQRTVDNTDMGYIQFGKNGADDDLLTFGKGSTEYMRIDGVGDVGINAPTPSAKFHVNGTSRFDHSVTSGFKVIATDTNPDQLFYGAHIDYNVSGSTALTSTRNHIGLFVDTDSTSTGGNTTQEHRVYGIYNDVQVTGDSDFVVGGFDLARTDHSSGAVSNMRGTYGRVLASHTAGSISAQDAGYFLAGNYATGSATVGTTSAVRGLSQAVATSSQTNTIYQGGFFQGQVTGTNSQNINQIRGAFNDVQIDANSNTFTVSNVYVTRSDFDNNDEGSVTVSNSYLYYGQYEGVLPNNPWGIYLPTDVPNYFAGRVGIGAVPNSAYQLDIVQTSGANNTRIRTTTGSGSNLYFYDPASTPLQNIYFGDSGSTSAGYVRYNHNGDSLQFGTGTVLRGYFNSGGLTITANSGATSHLFTFNESGGEIQLYSSAGTLGTLIDLTTAESRIISMSSGHNLQIGCGGSNTTGSIDFMNPGFGSVAMRLQNSGAVSIGTTVKVFNASGLPLIVGSGSGNQGMTIYSGTGSNGSIHFADTATTGVDSFRGRLRYDHNQEKMILSANAIDSIYINSVGRVGINESDPSAKLSVYAPTNDGAIIDFQGNANGFYPTSNFGGAIGYNSTAGDGEVSFWNCWTGASSHQGGFEFNKQTGGGTHTSLMKLGGDGDVTFGNSTADHKIIGNTLLGDTQDCRINSSAANTILEGDSTYLVFRNKAGTLISYQIAGSSETYAMTTLRFTSSSDNTRDLGNSGTRWRDAYIAGGVTTSSDERLKQQVRDINDAEARVALVAKGLLKAYKYNDAVEQKGSDARWHIGIIAQELKAAFEAEGLDAHDYGMFIWNEWYEADVWVSDDDDPSKGWYNRQQWETQEEAPSHAVRKDEYAVRYQELLAFIIAAI